MEFIIFAVMSIFAFLILLFNQRLPLKMTNGIIAGFMFVILGIFLLTEGFTIGSVAVYDTFTNAISLIYILFGISNSIVSAVYIKDPED
jgi:hypothetical protein